ncbi:DGQHR domain-containing protein [Pedobacter psychroterrae]|uniref:DGQHR domain-containing protein n=1 Tax=Pedobacter psychroterrae TaxID=2530453 RepID=A0A4R0NPR4_9SPHI|nr:DGQHR domain-containing protein [Pedobacter psychroterrae]TCD01225.1 DGQHR domain-containing protein [Pedobacter psychroterrae]
MSSPFIELIAFKVSQPLGEFYLTKIPAEELLKITFSSELRPNVDDSSEGIEFTGTQRAKKGEKLRQIGRYIDSVESAFPNSIILAANYQNNGLFVDDEIIKWRVEPIDQGLYKIIIPSREKLASIVDGQHRLEGFRYAENSERLATELVCSIYFDLPLPYQAYLFSTINHNQTPVSKSLSYILYGYNLEDETPQAWSTEKLAVYICRQLNIDPSSPFFKHIKVAPQIDQILLENINNSWFVSTATIVEGILSLITTNTKRDRDELAKTSIKNGRKRSELSRFEDDSPLRKFYLNEQDVVIRKAVENFFSSVVSNLFTDQNNAAFITKTIGIQALFDVLKENLKIQKYNLELDITQDYFDHLLRPFFNISFSDNFLMQSSAIGRSRLRNFMLYTLGYKPEFDPRDLDREITQRRRLIKVEDLNEYNRILAERN